jgi:hypothetical protein
MKNYGDAGKHHKKERDASAASGKKRQGKLPLCLTKYHAMKMYWGAEV